MTPFDERLMAGSMSFRRLHLAPATRRRLALLGLLVLIVLVVAACAPAGGASLAPGTNATPTPVPTPLRPAELKGDPVSVLSFLFTPIFQAFFLLLVGIYVAVQAILGHPDIGIAIILTTLVVRTVMVPLMRRQMVSMRQMQALNPEIKEIQRRYKGDRLKQQQAQSELMKERGVSQGGCLVALLPILLILPMYQVIREGLTAPDPTPMLSVFGIQIFHLDCAQALETGKACLQTTIPWLGGINAGGFEGLFSLPVIGIAISVFAIVYTLIQLIASRLALPAHDPSIPLDPQVRTQRAMSIWLPLITLLYSTVIPVGLFIYLIVSTLYQVGQQFLTTGFGGLFPLFGWTPAFAQGHKPRFPVASPLATASSPRAAGAPARPTPQKSAIERSASANATIRQRGRQGRRGRRR
jgi:YidC/Oxa1 family membrane protein insertase